MPQARLGSYLIERRLSAVPVIGVGAVGDGLGRLLLHDPGVLGGQGERAVRGLICAAQRGHQ